MKEKETHIIEITQHLKKRIYDEFNFKIYKELNLTIFDLNIIFEYRENYLFQVLDKAFNDGGPNELRKEINYIIRLFILIFNKVRNNSLYDDYDLIYHYSKKYYRQRKLRHNYADTKQLNLKF